MWYMSKCVDADVFFAYVLLATNVDLVCVMKACRWSARANMRKRGLKERAHAERRYIAGSIMVQITRETWLTGKKWLAYFSVCMVVG